MKNIENNNLLTFEAHFSFSLFLDDSNENIKELNEDELSKKSKETLKKYIIPNLSKEQYEYFEKLIEDKNKIEIYSEDHHDSDLDGNFVSGVVAGKNLSIKDLENLFLMKHVFELYYTINPKLNINGELKNFTNICEYERNENDFGEFLEKCKQAKNVNELEKLLLDFSPENLDFDVNKEVKNILQNNKNPKNNLII